MSGRPKPEPVVKPKCWPACHPSSKVESTYTLGGVDHDDSYCGVCGRNWPKESR